MNRYIFIIAGIIVVIGALVFLATKHVHKDFNPTHTTKDTGPKYYINDSEVDEKTFFTLKNTLMIGESGADLTSDKGGFTLYTARNVAGKEYTYLEGQDDGVQMYRIREN